jgi:hypothetical protein
LKDLKIKQNLALAILLGKQHLKGKKSFKSLNRNGIYCSIPNRVRTTSQSAPAFISASPPGFVSLEEIMKAANSVSKMALAHDIAVDDDFHLEKVDLPNGRLFLYFFMSQCSK